MNTSRNDLDGWWAVGFDPDDADQWYLKGPTPFAVPPMFPDMWEFDMWQFVRGEPSSETRPLFVSYQRRGERRDWTFASLGTPIVTSRVAELLSGIEGINVQFVPVTVEGEEGFFVANVLDVVDAVDEALSEGERVGPDEPSRTPGTWRMIDRLVLRSDALTGRHLIYPKSWRNQLCVSDTVVQTLKSHSVTGLSYRKLDLS